jgi:putative hemolysin
MDDPFSSAFPLVEIIGIVACLLASAFFSGSETTLTSISERKANRLIASAPERYGILEFWLQKKKRILSALLIGNNAVNILCSVLAYRVALFFLPHFAEALSVFGLTLVVLIFAEITPKSLAMHYAEYTVVTVLRFIWVIDKMLFVISEPLSRIPGLLVPGAAVSQDEISVTEDEIEYQIRLGHDRAVFEEKEQGDLLMSAVEFSDTQVKEVMLPRTDIIGLDLDTPLADGLQAVIESGHSRIPIFRENLDNIVGLLYAKDLLRHLNEATDFQAAYLEKIIRKNIFFAPETQKVSTLLAKMRRRGQHMAIVVDEFGGTSGLITLEDIIEELVGDIRDEFDFNEEPINRVDSETWVVDARVPLGDLKAETGIELPEDGDYESVGGFVVAEFGAIPPADTLIESHGVNLKVLASDPRHVQKVEIKLVPEDEQSQDE